MAARASGSWRSIFRPSETARLPGPTTSKTGSVPWGSCAPSNASRAAGAQSPLPMPTPRRLYNASDMKASGLRRSVRVGTLALALHLFASSLVAVAQPTGKVVHRIGFLRHFACRDEFGVKDLRQRLGELGYIEGRNIVIECRAAPGKWEELPVLAAELVRLNVDVLVTEGTPASLAAKQATRLVPVIMVYVGDPVASGLVSSLGRPGGNVTGVSMNANEIVSKDIELLKEIAPGISRVAVWMDSTNPSHLPAFAAMEATADRLKVRLQRVEVRTAADLDGGFAATLRQRAEAVAVYPLSTMPVDIKRIAEFAIKNRLPTVTNTAAYIPRISRRAPGRLRAERSGPVSSRGDLYRQSLEKGPSPLSCRSSNP